MEFPASLEAVYHRIDTFDPVTYARTRNFIDGGVSYLSPYLSRGFITVPGVLIRLKNRGFSFSELEKFIQELAWREYYAKTWFRLGDGIFQDIRHPQEGVLHQGIPSALVHAQTGIEAIDEHIARFPQTGYLHNHLRMYIASLACNVAHYHWSGPAAWMYYHLLDGDLASNALSWQWCAATFSNKPYWVNQENINHYTHRQQRNTVVDCSYEELPYLAFPDIFKEKFDFTPQEPNIPFQVPQINPDLPTFVYSHYTLDPNFHAKEKGNRILVLEPSHCKRFPMSPRSIQFIVELAAQIPDLQVYYGEYADLDCCGTFRDHPILAHWQGNREAYPFLAPDLVGDFPSFFSYWKPLMKRLEKGWSNNFQPVEDGNLSFL
ncbi:FAD-binding domain-containing protein [Aquirufa ecclesiirivi]|uniref:FAD-binding domain-containing protein n=1 Tax=Aquirufa ecclesiirivi TaxID=2715124 RepID=UPI0023D7C3C4|nr:FAD-binding domain-containing protein [Aquirufa ecclesiirivi]MDF0693088.1 FAD-binding domain-containing protein [Aquirufa ecclesiirivi]